MEEKKQPIYNQADPLGRQLSISIFENERPNQPTTYGISLTNSFYSKKKEAYDRQRIGTFNTQLKSLKKLIDNATQWCEENNIPTEPTLDTIPQNTEKTKKKEKKQHV